jgi:hypothetical protein
MGDRGDVPFDVEIRRRLGLTLSLSSVLEFDLRKGDPIGRLRNDGLPVGRPVLFPFGRRVQR